MPLPQKHPGADVHQRLEEQALFRQDAGDEVLRPVGHKDHTQRAAALGYLVDNGGHLHLLEAHLYVRLVQQVQELHKGHGAEGIALGGHGQGCPVGGAALAVIAAELAAAIHQRRDLRHQLAPLLRQRHAPVGAQKHRHAQLPLHLRNGGGQGGLGQKQVLRRPVHGAAAIHLQNVAHLQQRHVPAPLSLPV